MDQEILLEVQNLCKYYPVPGKRAEAKAVDGVSFEVYRGETLGLVGESGCGKSTAGRCILKLTEPTGGRIVFEGQDITDWPESRMRPLRSRMQIVFQDPFGCLDPRKTVSQILSAPLRLQGMRSRTERQQRVEKLM